MNHHNQQVVNAQLFRQLHQTGNPFILANVWDIGSARLMAAAGAVALATTSVGHAFTLGKPDGGQVESTVAIAHAADIARQLSLPVSGDFENGYGHSAQSVSDTIRLAIDAGLAGCSIEDTHLPTTHPYPLPLAVERIDAAVKTARQYTSEFVLTARADGIMHGHYDTDEAIKRLQAFERVGADVLYAPMPPDINALARICDSLSSPVNALVAGDFCRYSIDDFAAIGIARLSLGSSLARVTHNNIQQTAQCMFANGDFTPLLAAANGETIDAMLLQATPRNNNL